MRIIHHLGKTSHALASSNRDVRLLLVTVDLILLGFQIIKVQVFHHGDLTLLNIRIDLEDEAFLLMVLVIYYLVLLEGLISCVWRSLLSSRELIIDLGPLPNLLKNIIDVQDQHNLRSTRPILKN